MQISSPMYTNTSFATRKWISTLNSSTNCHLSHRYNSLHCCCYYWCYCYNYYWCYCYNYYWCYCYNYYCCCYYPLRWRHNGCNSVSNHQPRECLLRRLIWRTSKKTSKLRVTGLCAGNSPETGEFPAQMASNAENVSIWWRHHALSIPLSLTLLYKACRIYRAHEKIRYLKAESQSLSHLQTI